MNENITGNTLTVTEDEERRRAWLAERRKHITGTDVACILGLSKWGSPMTVWLDKHDRLATTENQAMLAGRLFEKPILEAYSLLNGHPLDYADHWTLHLVPDFQLLGASLDARWADGDRRPVDAKNIRFRTAEYGDEGSDRIPVYYQTQLAVQMMATGAPYAELAVCFGGQEFTRYTVERDTDIEAAMKEKLETWWKWYIIGDEMPEVDESNACTNYIKSRFERAETGLVKECTPEIETLVAARQLADANEKAAKAAKTKAENGIKAYMGDAEEIPKICTWKNNKNSEKTDWKGVAENLRTDLMVDAGIWNICVEDNTETRPGARVLRFRK